MIEELAREIPEDLKGKSGKVFYSGRAAWNGHGGLYVLGFNPGGDPGDHADETIESHSCDVRKRLPETWNGFCDESWKGKAPGQETLQRRLAHLFDRLGVALRATPASNLIFTRSVSAAELRGVTHDLIEKCWRFHQAVVDRIRPKAIVCLGNTTGSLVCNRLGATELVDTFTEDNRRRWVSKAYRNEAGLFVFNLTHPSRANWINSAADPSPMVREVLIKGSVA